MVRSIKKVDVEPPALTIEQLAKRLKEQGIELFKERAGLPLNQAQRNLEGRTHYTDDKTLASFVAKIHSVHVMDEGLMLGLVESVQAGPNADAGRVFRPVFFDVFGNTTYQPTIDESFDTQKQAMSDLWKQAEEIDPVKATINGIKQKQQAIQSELDLFTALLDELE